MDLDCLLRVKQLAKLLWNDSEDKWYDEKDWQKILVEHCSGDEQLSSEVCSFVRASQANVGEIRMEIDLPFDDPVFAEPEKIDRYRIVRRIGSGGMGIVYEARQQIEDDELPVALKLIKIGFDTEMFVRRFRNERYVLARLQHKNIVRILDAGSTPSGRPFFVMELVDGGLAFDEYCSREQLDIAARLSLFQSVCSAVGFAHSQSIVHRDLTPANILIDKHGDPKLLDFGLAKLLKEDETLSFARSVAIGNRRLYRARSKSRPSGLSRKRRLQSGSSPPANPSRP